MLDMDRLIYVWHGKLSNFSEKAKGMAIANIINNHERAGMAKIVMLDKGGTKVSNSLKFFKRILYIRNRELRSFGGC